MPTEDDSIPPPQAAPRPRSAPRKRKRKPPWGAIVGLVIVAAIAAGAFLYMRGRDEKAAAAAIPTAAQIAGNLSLQVGRVQGALMSGEVRQAGQAVATAKGEMVTTCHGLPPGAQISVFIRGAESRAEVSRANAEVGICTLAVADMPGEPVAVRQGEPAIGEKMLAVVAEGDGTTHRAGRIVRTIADANGPAYELELEGQPVPTGTPVMDMQARLVGIVTTPHKFGEAGPQGASRGAQVVALGAARIARARTAAPAR